MRSGVPIGELEVLRGHSSNCVSGEDDYLYRDFFKKIPLLVRDHIICIDCIAGLAIQIRSRLIAESGFEYYRNSNA